MASITSSNDLSKDTSIFIRNGDEQVQVQVNHWNACDVTLRITRATPEAMEAVATRMQQILNESREVDVRVVPLLSAAGGPLGCVCVNIETNRNQKVLKQQLASLTAAINNGELSSVDCARVQQPSSLQAPQVSSGAEQEGNSVENNKNK